ncbi:MAG: DUF2167 domain-containing protein [Nevskia sp.]|nr:DUF2167 domain-containing protein [Nevskia sp.]
MKGLRLMAAALALCATNTLAQALDPTADEAARKAEQFMASLKPQHGTIKLPNGVATLQLADGFYYLSPGDADRLITQGWGNPPGMKTLGMVLPQATNPLLRDGWGVVITYNEDGHVSDDDDAKIDYADLLSKMQKSTESENEQRKSKGYGAMHLVGWAAPPYYDAQTHKLYWAKELKADGAEGDTLNYNIRVLGRKGVLELTAVAAMRDFPQIKEQMPTVLGFTNFDQGNRYTDFDSSTDKVAAYGLAALVAGGIAAKAGLFAKLGLLLLAAKKFIIIGLAAVGAFFRKLFKRAPKP